MVHSVNFTLCRPYTAGAKVRLQVHFLGGQTCEDVVTPVLTDVTYVLLLLYPNVNERD